MYNSNLLFAVTLVLTTAAIPAVCQAVDASTAQDSALRHEINVAERALGETIGLIAMNAVRSEQAFTRSSVHLWRRTDTSWVQLARQRAYAGGDP